MRERCHSTKPSSPDASTDARFDGRRSSTVRAGTTAGARGVRAIAPSRLAVNMSGPTYEIKTKAQFFDLWEAGVLGNRLRIWRSVEDALRTGVLPVGFREIGKAGGGAFAMCNDVASIRRVAQEWQQLRRQFMICEAAPDEKATIQGEVCRTVGGWHGLLGLVKDGKRMRDSLRDGDLVPCSGVQVLDLLNRFMDPASRTDLEDLLDLYPDASVEFTCYSVTLGHLPGRRTICWEVRNY